jgi:hypothetical protein
MVGAVPRRASLSTFSLYLLFATSLFGSACAGNQAYLDWRPGLTELDFGGLFEISLDEFDRFVAEADANASFDPVHRDSRADAPEAMAKLGEQLAAGEGADPRGHAIVELDGDGRVSLTAAGGRLVSGTVDWFAISPDRRHAALLSKTKLAVAIDGASTGIDIGTLVGSGLAGLRLMMVVRDDELTVFALPEFGGVVNANEPGYLFAFRYQPGKRETWEVSVARVVIVM